MAMRLKEGLHQLDATAGWLRVNTFKEGLLARMGHDLTLQIEKFSLGCTIAAGDGPHKVELQIDKDSFQVIGPAELSAKDRAEIHRNICKHLTGNPSFVGTLRWDGERGRLEGQAKAAPGCAACPITAPIVLQEGRATARIELSHQALQIKPFRAPLGVIRLQDRVVLSFSFDLTSVFQTPDA